MSINPRKFREELRAIAAQAIEMACEIDGRDPVPEVAQFQRDFKEWLNAEKQIKYPRDFNDKKQELYIGALIKAKGSGWDDGSYKYKQGDLIMVTGFDGDGDPEYKNPNEEYGGVAYGTYIGWVLPTEQEIADWEAEHGTD